MSGFHEGSTMPRGENDLFIRRHIAAPRARLWACWTEPALLMEWYCPRPWRVTKAEMVLRAGGRFNTVMEGPAGERMDLKGVFLEVRDGESLVFTDAFSEGFIPYGTPFMVGYVALSDGAEGGTDMLWGARHWTAEAREKHLAMGFEAGWNAAADQLVQLAVTGRVA